MTFWQRGNEAGRSETPGAGRRSAVAFVALCCVLLTGCGYSLVGRASNIPEDIKRVYVEPLVNDTSRLQVEQILTQAILDELVTRRRFEVINDEADADAILRGHVLGFAVRPLTFDASGLADNFEIKITADMRFERPLAPGAEEDAEPEVIWSNARYLFRQDYPLETATGTGYLDRENIAIEETSIRFAETLVTDLLEGF